MNILTKYFSSLSKVQLTRFEQLKLLYEYWNGQINVISRKDLDNLYERHILHSLAIAKVAAFSNEEQVLDLGTGGGFPGVPLAIFFPETRFHLIDSIGKKIKVVQAIIDELELNNCSCAQQNVKNVQIKYDHVVSRAVARLELLMDWTRPLLKYKKHSKLLCLKGGNIAAEAGANKFSIYPIKHFYTETFFEEKLVVEVRK